MSEPTTEANQACEFCGYEFPESLGKFGCPNCHGEGLDEEGKPPCDCGARPAYWAGDPAGRREWKCEKCHESEPHE